MLQPRCPVCGFRQKTLVTHLPKCQERMVKHRKQFPRPRKPRP